MSSIDKRHRITSRPSSVEAIYKDPPYRHHHPQRRSSQRRIPPAASVNFSWRCPICLEPGQAPKNQQAPSCFVADTFPDEHAHIQELRLCAREQQDRRVADFLVQEAEQEAHLLRRRVRATTQ